MKPAQKSSLLLSVMLGLAALFGPGCGSSTEQTLVSTKTQGPGKASAHAKYLPEGAWMVATVRAGQIMGKLDYDTFVHMPAIAFLYSMSNPEFNVEARNKKERELAAYLTSMIEDPGESGIDLDRDAYFFLGPAQKQIEKSSFHFRTPSLPSFGFVLPLSDRYKFENLVELLLEVSRENDEVRRHSDKSGRYVEHENWFLAITDEVAFLQGAFPGNELEIDEIKQGLASPANPHPDFGELLQRPFDLALHLNFGRMLNILKPIILDGADGELDALLASPAMAWMEGATQSVELTAENGRLVLTERAKLGEKFKYTLVGPVVRDSMLDLLPADSIATASISLNVKDLRKMLLDMQKAVGDELWATNDLDLPPLDAPIPGLGLSIDEALSAFSGEITAALVSLPDPDAPRPLRDVPEFVLALSTVDPASKVYQDILKKKLLALFDKGLRDELLEETGISLVAKDNRLIIGSRGQVAILQAGKAPDPVGGDERALLSDGYFNLNLDFAKLAKALPIDRQRLREEEEIALDVLGRLDRLTIHATEKDGLYEATVALSLDDKKTNLLKQVGTFVGNLMDPAYRDPELRPRILAARKLAAEKPDHFRKALVGAWKNEWEHESEVPPGQGHDSSFPDNPGSRPAVEAEPQMERSHGVTKYLNRADGTHLSQHLEIESQGYYLHQEEGRWAVHGNSLLEYNEHGLLEWVGGILSIDRQKAEFYWIEEPFEEYETDHVTRVPDDWQLPDPPKDLPRLERHAIEDDGDDFEGETKVFSPDDLEEEGVESGILLPREGNATEF
ncbi:MAG: DUF4836 family protein [Opitutales bacterium]